MNRSLRRVHRRAVLTLALLVPPLFAAALLSRRTWQPLTERPRELGLDRAATERLDRAPVRTSATGTSFALVRDGADVIVALRGASAPSVLAYWTATTGPIDELPADAVLLGPVDAQARRLRAPDGNGRVVLYSLGHGVVVGHGEPETR